jgi:UPF0755 protein
MKDRLGIFGHPEETGEYDVQALRSALNQNAAGTDAPAGPPTSGTTPASTTAGRRARRARDRERHTRRRRQSVLAIVVLLVIAIGVVVGIQLWSNQEPPPAADYAGAGTTEVVIKVSSADSLTDIARSLVAAKVTASVDAFVQAGTGNADLAAINPGYYKVREGASAAAAISALLTKTNRVGAVEFIPGHTLADTTTSNGVRPGYLSQITTAACVPLNGVSNCFTVDALREAARRTPIAELGLPAWAVARVSALTDLDRRLEGMIYPGNYDIQPSNDAVATLKGVLASSAVAWSKTTLVAKAGDVGREPYDLVVIASIVEKEGITPDMKDVAEVIYNRLAINMRLQMDSTVNYGKNLSEITTNESDRTDPTSPYNTYAHVGLPPGPIGAVGPDSLNAAISPNIGPLLYFAKSDPSGKSCFNVTIEDHEKCVATARANGVF